MPGTKSQGHQGVANSNPLDEILYEDNTVVGGSRVAATIIDEVHNTNVLGTWLGPQPNESVVSGARAQRR